MRRPYLFKQGKFWTIRYWIRVDGKYVAKYKSTGLTKEGEAKDFFKKFLPQKRENILLSDFLVVFFDFKQVSDSTLKLYLNGINNFLRIVGDKLLSEYQLFDFELFKSKLTVKPVTINIHLRSVKSVFSYAVELGYINVSPVKSCKSIKIHENPVKTFTKEQLKEFTAPDFIYLPFMFALYSGLRIKEICTLKWSDIKEDSIVIHHSKSHKLRVIPLTKKLSSILRKLNTDNFVFLNAAGSPWNPVTLGKRTKKYLEKSGIKGLTFHGLRHTYATSLKNPLKAKELLGHSDIRTTMIYINPSIEDLRGEAESVDFGV